MQCGICCDTYTIQLRKPVECPFCEYKACAICVKKYLADGSLDAHCMSCRRGWNDDFLDINFTKAFRTGVYKKHREDVLLDREIAILPTRQARVEATLKLRDTRGEMDTMSKELAAIELKRQQVFVKMRLIQNKMLRYTAESEGRAPPAYTLTEGEKAGTPERAKFIMKCPDGECRGFLSTAYKCGTCQKWACSDCLVVKGLDKDTPHTCEPGQKETVALIIKESKPCPKCGQRISKIDGCDQMWCTDCHTAFSWTTGNLVNGVVHNPHYYEFLRKEGNGVAPRNAGDVECGGVPYYLHIQRAIRALPAGPQNIIMRVHRITSEIADQRLAQYQGHFNVNDNGDLAVKYLMKEIDRDAMKVELAKREVKRNKHLAIRAVLEMFVTTSTMILTNIINNPPENSINTVEYAGMPPAERHAAAERVFRPTITELQNLRTYVNESLLHVSRMKACSVPQIAENWNWVPFAKVQPKKRAAAAAPAAAAAAAAPAAAAAAAAPAAAAAAPAAAPAATPILTTLARPPTQA